MGGVSVAPYASLNLGGHVGDSAAAVAENRRRLRAAAGLPGEPMWLAQEHGTRVVDLDAEGDFDAEADLEAMAEVDAAAELDAAAKLNAPARRPLGPADAAFTRARGRVCAILTADCLPLCTAAGPTAAMSAAARTRGGNR